MDTSALTRYKMGGIGRVPVKGCPGVFMRIDDDIRKCVVFLGIPDDTPGKGGIACGGTAFLIRHDNFGYLVTARHVAEEFGDSPFVVRVNKTNGTVENVNVDNAPWHYHPDSDVDVAVLEFTLTKSSTFDALYFPSDMLALDSHVQNDVVKTIWSFGPGDLTYTVGLFQLLSGKKRNLPVVHSGSIAAVPRDEAIPVTDWRDKNNTIHAEGYLVETQALPGLSGSPVFVRRTLNYSSFPQTGFRDPRFGDPLNFMVAAPQMIFLT